jgi:hypothetical protein
MRTGERRMTNGECRTGRARLCRAGGRFVRLRGASPYRKKRNLLDDLERGALPVTGGGAGKKRSDRLNRLAIAADDSTNVSLAQLDPEDRRFPRRNLGKHHLIRKFHELADDEFEELFHGFESIDVGARCKPA